MVATGGTSVHISKPVRKFLLPSRQGIMGKWHEMPSVPAHWVSKLWDQPPSELVPSDSHHGQACFGESVSQTASDCFQDMDQGQDWTWETFLIIKSPLDQPCCTHTKAQGWPIVWTNGMFAPGTKNWGGSSGYWSSVALLPLGCLYPISRHPSSLGLPLACWVCGKVKPGF